MQTIYSRIETLIDSRNMTKKAFCEDLSISTGNFGDWKRGKSAPSANKLIEIAKYFDVSLDWLMTGSLWKSDELRERRSDYLCNSIETTGLTDKEKSFIAEYLEFSQYRKQKENNE